MHSAICWKTRVSVRYSSYSLSMGSDNPGGAENQQERLRQQGWVIGFVDGEGCFSIGFVRQSGGQGRNGYRTGYQVAHEFVVTQGAERLVPPGASELLRGGPGDRQQAIRQIGRAHV